MKQPKSASLELVTALCKVLDDKKASDLRVLDVSAQSSITDYLVLATGTSEPHLRALRIELERIIDDSKTRLVGMEARQESGWIVIDAFDVMIHLFATEKREQYALESLWKDATEVDVAGLINPAAAKPAKAPKAVKTSKPKAAKAKAPKAKAAAPKKKASAKTRKTK